MIRWLLILPLLLLATAHAMAAELRAVQGDVVAVSHAAAEGARLTCFGIDWPVRRMEDGSLRGWIGIDLKMRPGSYRIQWHYKGGDDTARLRVDKGNFRISRIKVAREMAVFDAPTLKRIRADQKALKQTYTARVDAYPEIMLHAMPTAGVISTPFGAQRYVNGEPRSPHSGIDIATAEGTPVSAPLAGKVLLVSDMYLNGNTVVIGHGEGLVSVYSHLASTALQPGQWVGTGEAIGTVGMSGRATGPHLHWGIRFHNARINPTALLPRP